MSALLPSGETSTRSISPLNPIRLPFAIVQTACSQDSPPIPNRVSTSAGDTPKRLLISASLSRKASRSASMFCFSRFQSSRFPVTPLSSAFLKARSAMRRRELLCAESHGSLGAGILDSPCASLMKSSSILCTSKPLSSALIAWTSSGLSVETIRRTLPKK